MNEHSPKNNVFNINNSNGDTYISRLNRKFRSKNGYQIATYLFIGILYKYNIIHILRYIYKLFKMYSDDNLINDHMFTRYSYNNNKSMNRDRDRDRKKILRILMSMIDIIIKNRNALINKLKPTTMSNKLSLLTKKKLSNDIDQQILSYLLVINEYPPDYQRNLIYLVDYYFNKLMEQTYSLNNIDIKLLRCKHYIDAFIGLNIP